ncbi:MAG: hypothetical protein K2K70_05140 [Lachnospiraceae bacterium]|nr:hypothetical protein [Lachnospiraceae bacterium]
MKKVIKTIFLTTMALISGGVLGAAVMWKQKEKEIDSARRLSDKHLKMMHVLNQWLASQQVGADISKYFRENQYHTIAIYGMSYLGERLLAALRGTDIEVKYCIDKRAEKLSGTETVMSMEDELPKVDAIIVTAVYFFDEIEDELSEKVDCPIISLEDVVKRL